MQRKPRAKCLSCSKEVARVNYTYCSNKCQADYRYTTYIEQWLIGKVTGLQRLGVVSRHINRYLREKYGDRCCVCSWSKINPYTQVAPLVADHIDGNWRNNTEANLRLICPNCDSLTSTYAGLNRGRGRHDRPGSNRVAEATKWLEGMSKPSSD